MGGRITTRDEEADLFDARFWLACEDEAGRILGKMTAADARKA
jgi:hypothetical protein